MGRRPRGSGSIHVVTNRRQGKHRQYVTHLLRRSYREGGKVKNETVGNISHLPDEVVELVRQALAGQQFVQADAAFTIERSLPAGHVQAVLAMARRLDLARLLGRESCRERDLCLAMIVQRVISPGSKLATSRALAQSTLADQLDVVGADEDDLYTALDWLGERQEQIERRLARRHLADGDLVLYDVSSSYFEGRHCPLAKLGYSRDGKRGTPQIVYGLLCSRPGRPIAVEVFSGELVDSKTLPAQLAKLKQRFGLKTIVLVGDRGIATKANIHALKASEGCNWITALKAPQIRRLVRDGHLQLSLFDQQNMAEITAPQDFPGERLIVCRNPLVAAERSRKRQELLAATETELAAIKKRVNAGTLHGAAQIGLIVGPAAKRYRMKKHFELSISDDSFDFQRKNEQIQSEASLDGFYVLRTSVNEALLDAAEVVRSYKQLEQAERAFKTFKGPELLIRPIHHRLEARVRAHVFLCMLAYYLTWHLRQAWAPLLFKDEQPPINADPVAKAIRSKSAQRKAQTKRTTSGENCHSFTSLIDELATQTRNTIRLPATTASYDRLTQPTPLQATALDLAEHAPVIQ